MTWSWLWTSRIPGEGFAFRSCQSWSFKKREQPQPPATLEFSPFQVSFCLSALSCQSTGLWWGSLSCTWSAERDVFRDEAHKNYQRNLRTKLFKITKWALGSQSVFSDRSPVDTQPPGGVWKNPSPQSHLILNQTPHPAPETSLHTHLLQVPEEKVVVFI